MLRALTVAVLLMTAGGCGGDDADPHALVACEGWTLMGMPYTGQCDLACRTVPVTAAPSCGPASWRSDGGPGPGFMTICTETFEFDGIRGCCSTNATVAGVHFYECP